MLVRGAVTTEFILCFFREYGVPKMNTQLVAKKKKSINSHYVCRSNKRESAGTREHAVPTYTLHDRGMLHFRVGQYTSTFSYSQYLIHTGMVGSCLDVISRYQNTKVLVYMCIQLCLREAVQYLLDTCSCSKKHTYI